MYCSRVLVTSDTNAAQTCLFKQKKSLSRGNEKPGVASFRPGSIRGPAGVLGSLLSVSMGSPGKDGQDGPRVTISGVPQQEITSIDSGENPTGPRTMGGWLPAYDGDSEACRGAANVPHDVPLLAASACQGRSKPGHGRLRRPLLCALGEALNLSVSSFTGLG